MTTMFGAWCRVTLFFGLWTLAGLPVAAQSPVPVQATASAEDPPARVGRLSDAVGTVWAYDPDAGDWVSAERNRPMTTGDRIATDAGAHADVRIGSTTVRLDGSTELLVTRLDDAQIALELTSGSIAVHVRDSESARQFAVATADGRFVTPSVGSYRFDLTAKSSRVSVLSGRATYEGPNSALTVTAGQRGEFWVDDRGVAQYVLGVPVRDAFAAWSDDRDRAEEASTATRYVSPEMTGIEDLDRSGTWQQTAQDGAIWLPTAVAADWVPYGSGHWDWVSPWGWTWVDDASWGFAPFHYGRWLRYQDRWAWSPGSYVARPCYAPALVGWIGGGPIGRGPDRGRPPRVGWFPLAPREMYVPHYRVTPDYLRNVNATHVREIPNIGGIVRDPDAAVRQFDYRNRRYAPSITTVPTSVLTARAPVAPAAAADRRTPGGREGGPRIDVALPTLAAPPMAGGGREDVANRAVDRRRDGMVPPAPIAGLTTSRQRVFAPGQGVSPAFGSAAGLTGATRPTGPAALPGPVRPAAVSPNTPPPGALAAQPATLPARPALPGATAERVAPLPPGAAFGRRQMQPFTNDPRGQDARAFGAAQLPPQAQPQPQAPERPAAVRPAEPTRTPTTVEAPPRTSPQWQAPTPAQAPTPGQESPAVSRRFAQPNEALRAPAMPVTPPPRPAVIVAPPQMPPMVRPAVPVAPVIPAQIAAPSPVFPTPPAAVQRGVPEDRGRSEERGRPDGQRQR